MDRAVQRTMLDMLAAAYPEAIDLHTAMPATPDDAILREASYLRGSGLIDWEDSDLMGYPNRAEMVTITPTGLDYLQDDGGVSRALSTVTIGKRWSSG